jgi:NAD(P)H-flavin reductase
MKEHKYIPRPAKIIDRFSLSDDVVGLRLKITDHKPFAFQPGQFVMLSVFGFGEVPIGITTSSKEKGHFEVAIRSVGGVTQKICSLNVGESIGVGGPFGNGFPLSKIKDKDLVLITGGIGLAPLRSLIRHIGGDNKLVKSLTILNGARSDDQLLYQEEYKDWEKFSKLSLTVDSCGPKWEGCVGNISNLCDRTKIKRGSVIIACGPPIMFPEIVKRYAGKTVSNTDLYFLLERRMKCGVGKCQHCTCGELYVCLDGPVFSYDQLVYNPEAFK